MICSATFFSPRHLAGTGRRWLDSQDQKEARHRTWTRLSSGVIIVVTSTTLWVGYQTRTTRRRQMESLPKAEDVWSDYCRYRSPASVLQTVQRTGLMGKNKSVAEDLEEIRQWHHQNGFKGGLVLRDLTKPLFWLDADPESAYSADEPDWTLQEILADPTRLARRECYYMYYEVKGNGNIQQQIFCRGTTLGVDIWTCLQTNMIPDDELGCRVHRGFVNHANRILEDVMPLLAPPNDPRATIEVSGHSLGGAAAALLAAKLQKRGYRVVRLTTVGEPRYCASRQDAEHLQQFLPKDTLRLESDMDFVPFLPPFGAHPGLKLWFTNGAARFVDTSKHAWTDSVWLNLRVPELLWADGKPHRIPSYIDNLKALIKP